MGRLLVLRSANLALSLAKMVIRIACLTATLTATVATAQASVDNGAMTPDETPPDPDAVTPAQVEAVMLAAQALVGVAAQSVTAVEDRVTLPQLRVLVLVAGHGTMNLNALAQAMDVHPSNATRACNRLVAAGLLQRNESQADRRHLVLDVTAQGRELVEQVMEHRRTAIVKVLARVPHPRRRTVTEAMGFFARLAGEVPAQDAWKLGWRT